MGEQTVNLNYAIGLPPKRAIEYFQKKGFAYSWNWRDTWQEAHAQAFTVAKCLRDDVLTDIRDAVDTALKDGVSFADFKKNLEPTLRKKGWWGKKMVGDETGGQVVQLGSPRRLKTIYNTNMRTAYSAGRYKEFMGNVADRPFWQYVAMPDARPTHAALAGVYRYDDPFWDTFYPPNDWGCRCRVRTLSPENVKDRGFDVRDTKGKIKTWSDTGDGSKLQSRRIGAYVDPDSGTVVKTGAGWAYNPGKNSLAWAEGRDLGKIVPGQKTYKDFGIPAPLPIDPDISPDILSKAATQEEAVEMVCKEIGLKEGEDFIFLNTADKDRVLVRRERLPHVLAKRGDESRERYAKFIRTTLEKPQEVWLTAFDNGPAKQYVRAYPGKKGLLVTVQVNPDGSLMWNVISTGKRGLNSKRKGFLLYKE